MGRDVTTRTRILNAEPDGYSKRAKELLQQAGELKSTNVDPIYFTRIAREFDVLIVRLGHRLDRDFLESNRHLKAVVTATTGLDHIDLMAAEEFGIAVLSLKGETEFLRSVTATAEHTWALLLALLRRIPEAAAGAIEGEWNRDQFRGHELSGKRLGILGLGRLGEKVARYGLAFEMEVMAFDPYREGWEPGVERAESLEELLEASDVLSIHLPLNLETEGIITARELALLPPNAVVINTARGRILDGRALVDAIRRRAVAGAAVDVVAGETSPDGVVGDPLVRFAKEDSRVIITPHIGGATLESMEKTEIFMAEKLLRFLGTDRV